MSIYNPIISLASKNYKWYFNTVADLISTYPTWGTWWFVNVGSTDTFFVWDTDTVSWVSGSWSSSWDLSIFTDTQDPTWFIDNANITISWNSTNRTVTLSHSTAVDYYWRWIPKTLGASWVSSAHWTDTTQRYYLCSTDWDNFTWSTTQWNFSDIMVTIAFYDTTLWVWIYLREPHGIYPHNSHIIDHLNIGTFRFDWWLPTAWTYALNTSTDVSLTPWFDEALVYDEDLPSVIWAWTEWTYTTGYTNSSNIMVFDTTKSFPFHNTTSWYINYFNNGVETQWQTWRFYNVYQILIPVASDTNSQKFRTILLQPQTQHTSLATAQAEDFRSLNLWNFTNLSPESVGFTRLTYWTSSSYATTWKVRLVWLSYLAWSRASQVSVSWYVPTNHNTLTWLQWGTAWEYYHLTANQLEKVENWVMLTDTDTNTVTTWWRYWMIGTPTNWAIAWEFYLEVLSDWTRIMQFATYLNWQVYTRYYTWVVWSSWVNADWLVWTKEVDETDIANDKILVYKTASWKYELEAKPTWNVTLTWTETLTNKRITKRVVTTTQSATPAINTDNWDVFTITWLAQAITSFTTNLTGTPVDWDLMVINITDNWTARALSWGTSFEASTIALPTTTVISTLLKVWFMWNTVTSKWRVVAVC